MGMTVKAAADAVGVSSKAIRLWEAKGLLSPAERTESGYRLFTDEDLDTLRFIRQAKALDLSLAEIKDILNLQRRGAAPCGHVASLLDTHIAEIDRTMADLRALRRSLVDARRAARESKRRGEQTVVCQVIESSHTR